MNVHPSIISRKAILNLHEHDPEGVRFQDMAREIEIDERSLSKNLFWLEEHNLVKLSTSLSTSSTFPKIIMIKLSKEGKKLAQDPEKLEKRFPTDEPVGVPKYRDYLESLAMEVRDDGDITDEDRERGLDAVKTLLSLSTVNKQAK